MDEILAHRPDCPYKPGFRADIQSHLPPEPFIPQPEFRNPDWYTNRERGNKIREMSRMEAVMYSPPVERTPSHTGATTHAKTLPPVASELTVTKAISGGDLRGAQPYYQLDPDGNRTGEYLVDTPWLADSDYSREAAAYEQFRDKKLTEGSFTLKYYGSYTMTLAASHEKRPETTRSVRLILVEYVDGITIHDLEKNASGDYIGESLWSQLDEQYRLRVWARILECDSLTQHAHVSTLDDHPRNRIIVPSPRAPSGGSTSSSSPRVILIDFGNSSVWTRTDYVVMLQRLKDYNHKKPVNPLADQWDGPFAGPYRAWVPDWYFTDRVRRHQWLIDEFIKGGEDKKYEKVDNIPEPGKLMHAFSWD